ncbi:peptide chain release factor N(5)-glutamine methyltransferase [Aquibacillus rhizosphaerae]|uniref:Release factor glutamine methyltransferase n=1 Tax=Aquibacillus rhizosphaerae TaxID=3051431 RepID=A0ABT7L1C1_9BACI|nr:peptide chain release factor N(5)-glutamine methyltransferase [Aquibacillus sp. LR5S19]MDL4839164.1 peptide chain release factor N(5)-glutamine methyltransferase [Aquibacillus sp. LR5S19]
MTKQPMTIHEALRWASLFLQEFHRETPVAEILLMHHLHMTKSQLLMSLRDKINPETLSLFEKDIKRHASTGVPVQHLTGVEDFYGREFQVNKDVLIPRPETEELVLGVLARVDKYPKPVSVVDLGTGSGIIAITLKLENPELIVNASDLSEHALNVAKQNAKCLDADIDFFQGDFLSPFIENDIEVDVIVSNPPYIPYDEEATLNDTVKDYDPALALFADSDGLAAYQQIINNAKHVLKKPGLIAFEIGHQQGKQVSELIGRKFPHSKVEVKKDINSKDRMVFAEIFA